MHTIPFPPLPLAFHPSKLPTVRLPAPTFPIPGARLRCALSSGLHPPLQTYVDQCPEHSSQDVPTLRHVSQQALLSSPPVYPEAMSMAVHLSLRVDSRELAPHFIGPFPISKVVMTLKLPKALRINPTFHVSHPKACRVQPSGGGFFGSMESRRMLDVVVLLASSGQDL